MTVEQLEAVHGALPFKPFTIHTTDGGAFPVDRPEFLSRSSTGRTIVVQYADDQVNILDLLLVTKLEIHPTRVD